MANQYLLDTNTSSYIIKGKDDRVKPDVQRDCALVSSHPANVVGTFLTQGL
jgi:hypothetical protein